jgi:hypothetical protein
MRGHLRISYLLHIKLSKDVETQIKVFTMLGKQILSMRQLISQPISTSELKTGVYALIINLNGVDHLHRVVKK